MNKKKIGMIKRSSSYIILLILFMFFIRYIIRHSGDFKQLSIVNPGYFIVLMIAIGILAIFNGLATKYVVKVFKVKLQKKEWFGLSTIVTFYNLITPFRGGSIIQATYLKHKHKLHYTSFLSGYSAYYIVTYLLSAIIGILSLVLIKIKYGIFSWTLLIVFSGLIIIIFGLAIFSPKFKKSKKKDLWIIRKIIELFAGWHKIKKDIKIISTFITIILLQLFMESIIIILQFKLFNVHIGFLEGLLLAMMAFVALLLSITPGGLGVHEAIIVFSARMFGINPAVSIASSIMKRVGDFIILCPLSSYFSYKLLKGNMFNGKKKKLIR